MRRRSRLKLHILHFTLLLVLLLASCGRAQTATPLPSPATLTPQDTPTPTLQPTPTATPTSTSLDLRRLLAAALPEHASSRLGKGPVSDVALSPTGEDFAVATSIGVYVYHLDPESGTLAETWYAPTSVWMTDLAFSPDGKTLAAASIGWSMGDSPCDPYVLNMHSAMLLWDAATGNLLQGFPAGSLQQVLAFSPDGRLIAIGGEAGSLFVLDRQSEEWNSLENVEDEAVSYIKGVNNLTFSPDGRLIAAGLAGTDLVPVWDLGTQTLVVGLHTGSTDGNRAAFSPDGTLLAAAGQDGRVTLWNAADWQAQHTLVHSQRVTQMVFSPDGASLVTSDERGAIYVWQTSSGQMLRNIGAATAGLEALRFSADGSVLFAFAEDHSIYRWSFAGGNLLRSAYLTGHESLESMAYSASANLIAAGTSEGDIVLYDLTTRQPVHTQKAHDQGVTGLAFAPDGRTLVSAGADGQVLLWGAASGPRLQKLRNYSGLTDRARGVAFSPDGSMVAAGTRDRIIVWQAGDGTQLRTFDGFPGLAFSPDGATLAYLTMDKIILADIGSGQTIRSLDFTNYGGYGAPVTFGPDGTTLLATSFATGPNMWDLTTGNLVNVPLGDEGYPFLAVAISSDGTLGAAGSASILVWSIQDRQALVTLPGHTCWVNGLTFLSGGAGLASLAPDGTILLWDLGFLR
jgi:WD40 repeat protein